MNCLKCGRTVPEHTLLCAECLTVRKSPAPEALALPHDVLLTQEVRKLTRSQRRLRHWVAVLLALSLAAAALLGGGVWYFYRQNSRITAQTSRINSLETAIEEKQHELEQANALNDTLHSSIAKEQELLTVYETYTGLTPDQIVSAAQASTEQNP